MSSVKPRNLLRDGCSPPTWLHQEIENKNHSIHIIRRNPFAIIWLNSLRLDRVGDRSAEDMGTSLDAELSLESRAFMKETWTPCPLNASSQTSIPRSHNLESNASSPTSVPRSHNMESNMHLRPAVPSEGSFKLGLLSRMNQQPPMHQLRMRPFKPFWGWTKNTSSPTQSFWFFSTSSLPESFSLLPTSLLLTSPLLPPSLHFALTPSLEFGNTWNGSQDNALELGARTTHLKQESEQCTWSKSQDNAFEAEAKTDRPERELEGKLPPFSFWLCCNEKNDGSCYYCLFFSVATKKAMTIGIIAFFFLVLL